MQLIVFLLIVLIITCIVYFIRRKKLIGKAIIEKLMWFSIAYFLILAILFSISLIFYVIRYGETGL